MRTRPTISWSDLTGETVVSQDLITLVRGLNKLSALTSLGRTNILLAVSQFHNDRQITAKIQAELAGWFLSDDIIEQLKRKFGRHDLYELTIFHSQQALVLSGYVLLHATDNAGAETENDQIAREVLGKALLYAGDLLVPREIALELRNQGVPHPKKAILLQRSAASGLEVNNPPNIKASLTRSDAIFGDILKRTTSILNLDRLFKERTGMDLSEYVDFNIGALSNYIIPEPERFIENGNLCFLNTKDFFSKVSGESIRSFWNLELGTLTQYQHGLGSILNVAHYHDFTPFRKRPFFEAFDDHCMPIHPSFIQEKLEAGLFWTIFHTLRDNEERDELFRLWGHLFEVYINEKLSAASHADGRFIPFPKYLDTGEEAFDGIILQGETCFVFECKGGFLKAEAKYSDDPDILMPDLEMKFGSSETGALRQLASRITRVFAKEPAERRDIEGLDLRNSKIVVPVLVVQEKFVSSPFTSYFLAHSFRSELGKQRLARDINCQCQGLIVMDAYDVEALKACNSRGNFSLADCLFSRTFHGDVVLDFHAFLIEYAQENGLSLKADEQTNASFAKIIDRVSERFFERPIGEKTNGDS